MRIQRTLRLIAVSLTIIALGGALLYSGLSRTEQQVHGAGQSAVSLEQLHALIFVWASGTPAVQDVARHACGQAGLAAADCPAVSAAVRAAWLDLAAGDPAALGRVGVAPNPSARATALTLLGGQLASAAHGRTAQLLSATAAAYAQIQQPDWITANALRGSSLPAGTVLVWATAFQQSSLPSGLSAKKSLYVALPDAYIKYANWGNISSIPAIYQTYYAPTGGAAHWTVNVATADGSRRASNALVTDVGPWNEDDNWWDANGTSATLPASCPVAAATVAPDATSNALVNGICPNGQNLRRVYYYLLYTHNGLPFFQTTGYAPSGTFQDGAAWPAALAQNCAEAAGASVNQDGITCYGGSVRYNGGNGGWLRGGTHDGPILNQSSVDLSPATDRALGWTYPSSGLVQLYVGALP
ncbi:MAG TPA: hypothetical protein VGR57_17870 [Ktedonobacterales bacterium]|nr:hypothetical protein [Ktedonobacterales bacterium]